MDFSTEVTQLFVIILVLLAVLMGVNLWVKRGGGINMPTFGGSSGNTPSALQGLEDEEPSVDVKGTMRNKGGKSSAADRHGDRFNLTGKDAEAAARVLKRMLKQDKDLKEKS